MEKQKRIYPRFRHHKSEAPVLVRNEKEEAALGPDWKESPACFLYKGHPEANELSMDPEVSEPKEIVRNYAMKNVEEVEILPPKKRSYKKGV